MRGITRDTFVETVDRKILYVFLGLTLFGLLIVFLTRNAEFNIRVQTNGSDLSALMFDPVLSAIKAFLSILLFLAVMASTAHFPTMLERGRAEFYLAKPLSRQSLLLNKYLGLLTVYGGIVMLAGFLCYSLLAVIHGVFTLEILYLFLAYLLSLTVWLSVTTVAAVFSGSTAMTVMTAFLVWALQSILAVHTAIKAFFNSAVFGYIIDTLYYIVPKNSAIETTGLMMAGGRTIDNWVPVWSSLLFAAFALYAAVLIIKRKDY